METTGNEPNQASLSLDSLGPKTSRRKRWPIYLGGLILALCLFGFLAAAIYQAALHRPNFPQSGAVSPLLGEEERELVVEYGETAEEIAQRLYQEGLINSPALLRLYLLLNRDKTIQAGRYYLPANLNLIDLVERLGHGTFDVKMTFPEGIRIEEMAVIIAETREFNLDIAKDFLANAHEGYLFPDTYFFHYQTSGGDIAERLKTTFNERYQAAIDQTTSPPNLNQAEIIIVASIVEREIANPEDRPQIAGILLKRFENGWPLEADATIQYLKAEKGKPAEVDDYTDYEWWPKIETQEDLEIDSLYNTRKYRGLPPSPICNPSLNAIEAVLNPKDTNYWFYLSGKDGQTHFAETIEEHTENVQKYLN